MKNRKNNPYLAIGLLLSTLALAACSGGGNGNGGSEPDPPPTDPTPTDPTPTDPDPTDPDPTSPTPPPVIATTGNLGTWADTAADDTFPPIAGTWRTTGGATGVSLQWSVPDNVATTPEDQAAHGAQYNRKVDLPFLTLFYSSTTGAYRFAPNDAALEALKTAQTASFTLSASASSGPNPADVTISLAITATDDSPTAEIITDNASPAGQAFAAGISLGQAYRITDRDDDIADTAFAITRVQFTPPASAARDVTAAGLFTLSPIRTADDSKSATLLQVTDKTLAAGRYVITVGANLPRPYELTQALRPTPVIASTGTGELGTWMDTAGDDDFTPIDGTWTATVGGASAAIVWAVQGNLPYDIEEGEQSSQGSHFTHRTIGTYSTLFYSATDGRYRLVAQDAQIEALKDSDATDRFTLTATSNGTPTTAPTELTLNLIAADDTPESTFTPAAVTPQLDPGVALGTYRISDRDGVADIEDGALAITQVFFTPDDSDTATPVTAQNLFTLSPITATANSKSASLSLATGKLAQTGTYEIQMGTGPLAQSHTVTQGNTPATGIITINPRDTDDSGALNAGDNLIAAISPQTPIADADGLNPADILPANIRWQRTNADITNWQPISGAQGSSYTLQADDIGKRIRARLSFTDRRGKLEIITSNALLLDPAPDVRQLFIANVRDGKGTVIATRDEDGKFSESRLMEGAPPGSGWVAIRLETDRPPTADAVFEVSVTGIDDPSPPLASSSLPSASSLASCTVRSTTVPETRDFWCWEVQSGPQDSQIAGLGSDSAPLEFTLQANRFTTALHRIVIRPPATGVLGEEVFRDSNKTEEELTLTITPKNPAATAAYEELTHRITFAESRPILNFGIPKISATGVDDPADCDDSLPPPAAIPGATAKQSVVFESPDGKNEVSVVCVEKTKLKNRNNRIVLPLHLSEPATEELSFTLRLPGTSLPVIDPRSPLNRLFLLGLDTDADGVAEQSNLGTETPITFAPGTTQQNLIIIIDNDQREGLGGSAPLADDPMEAMVTFALRGKDPTSMAALGENIQHRLRILDDDGDRPDPPIATFGEIFSPQQFIFPAAFTQDSDTRRITVNEDAPPSRTNYEFQSFEFHLPLSITPAVPAGALSFTVTLSTPDGATPATCADNPAAGIFSLSLPPASTGDYQWATTPGDTDADDRTLAIPCNDDNTSTTTLTFNPTLQEHWLHFSIRRDSVEEPSETILLTLTPGEGATTANLGGKDSLTYRIEIAPSDPP